MQSQLLNQNLNSAKATDKACRNYNRMKIKYNDLSNTIASIPKTSKISESLERDEVNEVYEFTHQFDGSSGIKALIFRENVKNYVKFVKHNLATNAYSESRLITRIIKGLTNDAKLKYSQRQGDRFDSLNAFYKWFDTEFQLSNLRSDLFSKLKNWETDPNIPKLNIVQEYKRMLNLFNLTESITAQSILDLTQLSVPVSVNAIIKSSKQVHPRIHSFIDYRFKTLLRMPNSFSQLEGWIKDACIYIETADVNSNKQNDDSIKSNMANTVLNNEHYEQYDPFGNKNMNSYEKDGKRYDDRHSGNNNGNRNNRKYYDNNNDGYGYDNNNDGYEYDNYNEQHQSYQGQRSDYNNKYSNRNYDNDNYGYYNEYYDDENYQSFPDKCYDDYDNNNEHMNNNDYNNYNQYDCGQENWNSNEPFDYYNDNSKSNWQQQQCQNQYHRFKGRYLATPRYKQFECDDCGIWGHAAFDCKLIRERFPKLLIEFANLKNLHCKKSETNTNIVTQNSNNNGNKQANYEHTEKESDNSNNK